MVMLIQPSTRGCHGEMPGEQKSAVVEVGESTAIQRDVRSTSRRRSRDRSLCRLIRGARGRFASFSAGYLRYCCGS